MAIAVSTSLTPISAFKPKKVAEGTKQYQLKQYAEQTLVSCDLRMSAAGLTHKGIWEFTGSGGLA